MSRYWSPLLKSLSPYVSGEQPRLPGLIKLNTNELPWGPSEQVLKALRGAADDDLRLYPDPDSSALRRAFAAAVGVLPGQVFVGNGSDEILAHSFQALMQPAAPILFPDITYSFYPVYCGLYGLQQQAIPLREDFSIALEDYRRRNGGIIFPNPNAPTGLLTPLQHIKTLLQNNRDTVVIVDEAYIDFGGESAASLIADYPNLLVIQTLSKSRALAGLRVGAAFGDEELIAGLERVKNSFNSYPLDRLAEAGAVAALEDHDWFVASCARLVNIRDGLLQSLQAMGFEVLPSAANFLFVRHLQHDARTLSEALRERAILVRYFDKPRINQFLRISVGDEDECAQLLQALPEILGSDAL
ncbi:MAG: histidinol-phosphate transaminase [Gammaproteobacteria bacterium]|nr:histidinol-phosphate transaminase [Gammaproteobacteria bacterium]